LPVLHRQGLVLVHRLPVVRFNAVQDVFQDHQTGLRDFVALDSGL
jgi:hypothetical protein